MIDPENYSPYPKNPTIAKFFKEIGWVDELGSGVRNIYKYNKIYSGADPEFIEGDVLKTIIPLTPQVNDQASPQVTPQDEIDIENQRTESIMQFYKEPKSRKEIRNFLVTSMVARYSIFKSAPSGKYGMEMYVC